MIDQWLQAIEDLILTAPGNADEEAGDLWDDTLTRLGETDEDEAAERVHWDLLEADDVAPSRPFFVVVEADLQWYTPGNNAFVRGAVDLFYSEQAVDPEADDPASPVGEGAAHKRSKAHFAGWVGQLIANCADRISYDSPIKIERIEMLVPPQRTPREFRDQDDPTTDYWWCCFRFHVGQG
jgi:hypothetical protein